MFIINNLVYRYQKDRKRGNEITLILAFLLRIEGTLEFHGGGARVSESWGKGLYSSKTLFR